MVYAIVGTGGKQYRVSKNDILEIEKLDLGKARSVNPSTPRCHSGSNPEPFDKSSGLSPEQRRRTELLPKDSTIPGFTLSKVAESGRVERVKLDHVLLYADGKVVEVGRPYVKGAKVECEVLGEFKGDKVVSFKYKKRKGYHRKVGHRQKYTRLKVTGITVG